VRFIPGNQIKGTSLCFSFEVTASSAAFSTLFQP
jgi:hypothetical protein